MLQVEGYFRQTSYQSWNDESTFWLLHEIEHFLCYVPALNQGVFRMRICQGEYEFWRNLFKFELLFDDIIIDQYAKHVYSKLR